MTATYSSLGRYLASTVKYGSQDNSEIYASVRGLPDKFFTHLDLWVPRDVKVVVVVVANVVSKKFGVVMALAMVLAVVVFEQPC